ncbi:MAG: hypothetical protein ACLFVX_10680 [Archaeoglobaceae archaeon]
MNKTKLVRQAIVFIVVVIILATGLPNLGKEVITSYFDDDTKDSGPEFHYSCPADKYLNDTPKHTAQQQFDAECFAGTHTNPAGYATNYTIYIFSHHDKAREEYEDKRMELEESGIPTNSVNIGERAFTHRTVQNRLIINAYVLDGNAIISISSENQHLMYEKANTIIDNMHKWGDMS